jgi:hypothetical protein
VRTAECVTYDIAGRDDCLAFLADLMSRLEGYEME